MKRIKSSQAVLFYKVTCCFDDVTASMESKVFIPVAFKLSLDQLMISLLDPTFFVYMGESSSCLWNFQFFYGIIQSPGEWRIMKKLKDLKDLVNKYKLSLVLLFGSHVHGDVHPESDMDIAIYGKKILSEADKINLTYEFSKIFHKDKIDVVDIKTSHPLLKREIFKDYKVLYQRNPMLVYQLELVSLHEFKESEILCQIRHERLQEFIR